MNLQFTGALALFSIALSLVSAGAQDDDKKDSPEPAAAAETPGKPESLTDQISYAYGYSIATQMKSRGVELNLDQFTKAFKGVLAGEDALLTEEEMDAAFEKMAEQQIAKMKEEGTKFLEENGKKEGIVTTDSGLQYEVLKEGEGDKPAATDTVTVHYHGTLLDGKVFDSSVERGEPTSFPLNRVIPGWTEGVQLMPLGAKYRFYIPSDLAYGERGAGGDIPPHSALIFEVELLKIGEGE